MDQDEPISGHREFHRRLIPSGFGFARAGKYRNHSRVRHVCFQRDARSVDLPSSSIRQSERDCHRAYTRRIWRNFMREYEVRYRFVSATLREREPDTKGNQ